MKVEMSDETESLALTDDVRRGFMLHVTKSALWRRGFIGLE